MSTTNETSTLCFAGPLRGKPQLISAFHSKRPIMRKVFPWHFAFMINGNQWWCLKSNISWRHVNLFPLRGKKCTMASVRMQFFQHNGDELTHRQDITILFSIRATIAWMNVGVYKIKGTGAIWKLALPGGGVMCFDTFKPRQDGRHFPGGIFKCFFMNEKFCILIKISLKCVPNGPIDNKWALVHVMACRRSGSKLIIGTNADPVH